MRLSVILFKKCKKKKKRKRDGKKKMKNDKYMRRGTKTSLRA